MQLIKITVQNGKQVVSARELYDALGFNSAHWAKWYNKNILKNQFAIEDVDYTALTLGVNVNKTEKKDFALTLDFAKKLSMMARTDKGDQVRDYFLACEKKAENRINVPAIMSPAEMFLQMAQNFVAHEKEIGQLRIEQQEIRQEIDEFKAKAKTQPDDYYAIAGYAATIKKPIDVTMASAIGKKASAICNRLGYVMGTIPDPRFGRVKTYPKQVLAEVFNNHFSN